MEFLGNFGNFFGSQAVLEEELGPGWREEFVETYSDETYQPVVRKAVLDVVVAVAAADRLVEDVAFRMVVGMLEPEESNEVIRAMKLVMLDKITEDALSDMDDLAGLKFKGRMDYFRTCIG